MRSKYEIHAMAERRAIKVKSLHVGYLGIIDGEQRPQICTVQEGNERKSLNLCASVYQKDIWARDLSVHMEKSVTRRRSHPAACALSSTLFMATVFPLAGCDISESLASLILSNNADSIVGVT